MTVGNRRRVSRSPDRVLVPVRVAPAPHPRFRNDRRGHPGRVFFFFSNRLGCLGSLLVSAVLTIVVLLVLDVL